MVQWVSQIKFKIDEPSPPLRANTAPSSLFSCAMKDGPYLPTMNIKCTSQYALAVCSMITCKKWYYDNPKSRYSLLQMQLCRECCLKKRIYRTYSARFSISFFSWLAYFSGKADASQKQFSPWSPTSKKFHQKIPTRSKVMAISKQGTSGAIYFLSTWL